MRCQQLETQTGQPAPGDTDQLGDPTRLKIQQAPVFAMHRDRGGDLGGQDALDSQNLTPFLRALHHIEHVFDSKKNTLSPTSPGATR
jgi:hypothetical protein